jgi:hypothetical protein
MAKTFGVKVKGDRPSILAGQAILESDHFRSELWRYFSHNWGGIQWTPNSPYQVGKVVIGRVTYGRYLSDVDCAKCRIRILELYAEWVRRGIDPIRKDNPILSDEEREHLSGNVIAQLDRWWAGGQRYGQKLMSVIRSYSLTDLDVTGALKGTRKGGKVADWIAGPLAIITMIWSMIVEAERDDKSGAEKKKTVLGWLEDFIKPWYEKQGRLVRAGIDYVLSKVVDWLVDGVNVLWWKRKETMITSERKGPADTDS